MTEPTHLQFVAAKSEPLPAPPELGNGPALSTHEVFGFAPYWTLPNESGYPLAGLTTVAYFGVDVAGNGSLITSGNGWNGYQSQQLVDLINRAHQLGTRVVLTAKTFDNATLDQLARNPRAGPRLSSELAAAILAKKLDGVNLDLEGTNAADRQGISSLIRTVAAALHAENNHWQVTVDSYSGAADDQAGFFEVRSIAPAIDAFFVMGYDMGLTTATPSANAPLSGPGWNDTKAIASYISVVSAGKVLLGIPLYGYDWPVSDGTIAADAIGPPKPVSYGEIASQRLPEYWDPATQTPWTRYQDAEGGWHQVRYDDPTSIALKTRFANDEGLRGVGVWALGMDGNSRAITAALLGGAVPLKMPLGGLVASAADTKGEKVGENKPSPATTTAPQTKTSPALTPIAGLTATSTPFNQINLSWQPATGGAGHIGYQIFAAKQANFAPGPASLVAETTVTSFTHAGLGLGEEWYYLVRAVDSNGDVGPSSAQPSATSGNAFLIEAELLLPANSGPDLSAQRNCCGVDWSGGAQLLFSAARSGQSVDLQLPVLPAGKYELSLEPTLGPAYGTLGVAADGEAGLTRTDEFASTLQIPSAPLDLGQVVLRGQNDALVLTVVGKDNASTGYELGVDYFTLTPQPSS